MFRDGYGSTKQFNYIRIHKEANELTFTRLPSWEPVETGLWKALVIPSHARGIIARVKGSMVILYRIWRPQYSHYVPFGVRAGIEGRKGGASGEDKVWLGRQLVCAQTLKRRLKPPQHKQTDRLIDYVGTLSNDSNCSAAYSDAFIALSLDNKA